MGVPIGPTSFAGSRLHRRTATVAARLHQRAARCLDNGNRLFVELVDPIAGDALAEKGPRVGGTARATPRHGFKARKVLDLGEPFVGKFGREKIE